MRIGLQLLLRKRIKHNIDHGFGWRVTSIGGRGTIAGVQRGGRGVGSLGVGHAVASWPQLRQRSRTRFEPLLENFTRFTELSNVEAVKNNNSCMILNNFIRDS
jgi:diaminopimelate epimerase